jgi:hypothetical protein
MDHDPAPDRIDTQLDLHRLWEGLVQPLGFGRTSVWVSFIGSDREPLRLVMEVTDRPDEPDERDAEALLGMLAGVFEHQPRAGSVALLVTHPGWSGVTDADRRRAGSFLAAARRHGVPCEPVHVADDLAVHVVTPDLAA